MNVTPPSGGWRMEDIYINRRIREEGVRYGRSEISIECKLALHTEISLWLYLLF